MVIEFVQGGEFGFVVWFDGWFSPGNEMVGEKRPRLLSAGEEDYLANALSNGWQRQRRRGVGSREHDLKKSVVNTAKSK